MYSVCICFGGGSVFCCPVLQGYGLTETGSASTLQLQSETRTLSVGPPLPCCGTHHVIM